MSTPNPGIEEIQAIDEHGAKVQAMFSAIAPGYDRANRWMSLGTDVRWRRRGVARLGEVAPQKILDLCAGTLDSSKEIHRAYPEAEIIGGDFSAGMLAAGERTLTASQRAKIHPQQLDAHHLPFENASFDALFCAFAVRNLSDLERATAEKARCLRPGGQLVILDFFRPQSVWTKSFHGIYNHSVLPIVGWICTGNREAYRYLPRSIGKFVSDDQYAALLEKHGFESITIERLTGGIATLVSARRDNGEPKS